MAKLIRRAQPMMQPTPQPTQQSGGLGSFLQGLASYAIAPARRAAGLGLETSRALSLSTPSGQDMMRRFQEKRRSGQPLSALEQLFEKTMMTANPLWTSEEEGKFGSPDPMVRAGMGVKTAVGLGSYMVPGGAGLKGALTMGAAMGGMREFAEPETTAGRIGGAAVGGAAGGAAFYGAGKALDAGRRALGRVGKGAEQVGEELRGGVLKPQAKATPFYSEEVAGLSKTQEQLGLKGSAKAQLEQLGNSFKQISEQIKSKLQKNPVEVSAPNMFGKLDDALSESGAFIPGEGIYEKAKDSWFNLIKKDVTWGQVKRLGEPKSGTIDVNKLFAFKQSLGNKLGSAWKKLGAGTSLNPKEEAGIVIYNAIKDIIDAAVPGISAMTEVEHQMFNLSKGLVESATGTAGVRGFKGGIGLSSPQFLTRPTQALIDWFGRGATQTGAVTGAVEQALPTTAAQPIGQKVAAFLGGRAGGAPTAPQPTTPTTGIPAGLAGIVPTAPTTKPLLTKEQASQAMMIDMLESGGQNVSKIQALYEFGLGEDAEEPSETQKTTQTYANIGLNSIQKAKADFGITDWGELSTTDLTKMMLPGGIGARKELAFLRTALMNLAFAMSGKQMSWKEVELQYGNYLPIRGDSLETARAKIQSLEDSLGSIYQGAR